MPTVSYALDNLSNTVITAPDADQDRNVKRFFDVVDVLDYMHGGAVTAQEVTDEFNRLKTAVGYALSTSKALWIPPTFKVLRVNDTIEIPAGGIDIFGGGKIVSTADKPLFKFTGGASLRHIRDFTVEFELSGEPMAACAIEIAGTNQDFFQYNRFSGIATIGALSTIIVSKDTYTTKFGPESTVAWCTFDDLRNFSAVRSNFTQHARNVIWFKKGSGTGNLFRGFKGFLGARSSAYARFDGPNCVVGDIIFCDAHLGASPEAIEETDCVAVEVGPDTIYRNAIAVVNSQCDANVLHAFRLSPTGSIPYENIVHDGSLGGETNIGIGAPILSQRIDDRDQAVQRGGFQLYNIQGTGTQTIPILKVSLLPYSGARIRMVVAGKVAGYSGGCLEQTVMLQSEGASTYVAKGAAAVVPQNPSAAFFTIQANSSSTLDTTISVQFSPTLEGSNFSANWEVIGSSFNVQRFPKPKPQM